MKLPKKDIITMCEWMINYDLHPEFPECWGNKELRKVIFKIISTVHVVKSLKKKKK